MTGLRAGVVECISVNEVSKDTGGLAAGRRCRSGGVVVAEESSSSQQSAIVVVTLILSLPSYKIHTMRAYVDESMPYSLAVYSDCSTFFGSGFESRRLHLNW